MIGCGGGVEDTVDGNQGSSQASHFIDHLLLWQQAIKKESKKGMRFFDDMSRIILTHMSSSWMELGSVNG